MNEKFMQLKKMVIPTITVLVITSQLCGCAAVNSNEASKMIKNNEAIEITIAEPVSVEQGTEIPYEWVQLAQLTTYEDFRTTFDSLMNITKHGVDGKNGPVYINLSGDQTDNSTLYYAFMNKTFVNNYWNKAEKMEELIKAINDVYSDIESDAEAQTAILNAYFNIFPDAEPNYFNGSSTLTRGEFLAGFYRATTPVQELEEKQSFTELVGKSDNTIYVQQIADKSYLDTTSKSLNKDTFSGTITRAEAIYTIVKTYYPDEYAKVSDEEVTYDDVKNGGNIAEKQKYIKYDKKSSAWSKPDYWKSYELYYAVNNPDKGLPTDLYKALVVAYNHNLISTTEDSNWELGLTKSDAIQLLINTYEDLVNSGNYLTDLEIGKAFNIATDQTSSSGGSGAASTENNAGATNISSDNQFAPEVYYTEKEDGTIEFTQEGLGFLYEYDYFEGASVEEINAYFNDDSDNGGKPMLEYVKRENKEIMEVMFSDVGDVKPRLHEEKTGKTESTTSSSSTTTNNNNQASTDKSTTNQQQQQAQQSQAQQQQATSQEQQQPATQTPSQSEVQQSEAPVSDDQANITAIPGGFQADRNIYIDTTGNGGDPITDEDRADLGDLQIY